jgi:diphosphomevalonate decarboxylase
MSRVVAVRAPSNIALVKYMGKTDSGSNLPENASLSMTLDRLCTVAETWASGSRGEIEWTTELPRHAPSSLSGLQVPMLSDSGRARVIRHVQRVRDAVPGIFAETGLKPRAGFQNEGWCVRSANTFPPASGIASSASSFASLTLATALACAEDPAEFRSIFRKGALKRALAAVSRVGSGSSSRSFEGPWVLWEGPFAAAVSTSMPRMSHFVILVSSEPKKVPSSDAHLLVKTSPLWSERPARANDRTRSLVSALVERDFREVARIAWTEAWEMHSLFHTCSTPFTYWEPGTLAALQFLAPFIETNSPPIVTLDAGPNVHVIVPQENRAEWKRRLHDQFGERIILEDGEGSGAEILHVE